VRITLAGASGFLGSHLADRLRAGGHQLTRLVRRPPTGPDELRWDPRAGTVDQAALTGVDAVVNLGGASISGRRWTAAYKRELLDSRLDTTGTIARAIAAMPAADRPRVLVSASGVDFYGDGGETVLDENAPPGTGFLPELARAWEAATRPAEDAGTRVVLLRTGFPLHRSGGMLKPLLIPFRLGVGGPFGTGRQWFPWMSLADWVGAVDFLIGHDDVAGPVNMCGPEPVRNKEFAKALGRAVHRPALLRVPKFGLKVVLGELAEDTVTSKRMVPAALLRAGYRFAHSTVDEAVVAAVQHSPSASTQ